jgi:uncharacterized protein YbjQ (UPF0145 family)
MKRTSFFVLGAVMLLLVFTGCATSLKEPYSGTLWNIGVPAAKDVEIIGLVHYEAVLHNGTGEKLTYDALLREAEKLGGNGIVNVLIDVKNEGIPIFSWIFDIKQTWYGTALAIKYLNENLSEIIETVDENGETTTKTSTPRSIDLSSLTTDPLLKERIRYLEKEVEELKRSAGNQNQGFPRF